MSARPAGLVFVRALARVASLCYPASFRRTHARDFVDIADHHFDRARATRRPAGAALAASRVIVTDTVRSAPSIWMQTIAGNGEQAPVLHAIWNRVTTAFNGGRHDLWLAGRAAARRPGVSLMVVLTLGLGMGASTAAFDALDRAILRPLPFPRSDELTLLVMEDPQFKGVTSVPVDALNEWRAKATTVRQVEVFRRMSAVRNTDTGSDVREAIGVSGGLPSMLGIRPVAGRLFTASDAQPDAAAVVMIGEDYWRSAFGGSPSVIGQTITIAGKPMEVIGVWPAGARLDFFETPDIFRVLPAGKEYGRGSWVQVLARRKSDRSISEVEQELAALTPRDPTRPDATRQLRVQAIAPGSLLLGDQFVAGVWLVFAGGLILLGAAIVNAGHLLLERAANRHHELGVRLALGGSHARLFRMFLAEGVVYAVTALAMGACVAAGLEHLISTVEPRLYRDAAGSGIFGRAFLFAAGTSMVAALCCSLAPLVRAGRRDVSATLGQHNARVTSGRSAFTNTLVAVQAGFAVLLVFGAALMSHSLGNLLSLDPGIALPRLAELSISLPAARYPTPDDRRRYVDQARAALASLPGVTGVLTSGMPLLQASLMGGVAWLDGEPAPTPPPGANTAVTLVKGDYFRIMGLRTIAGRTIADDDKYEAVVDESFARARGGNVIGRLLHLPNARVTDPAYRIVGVVNDVRYSGLSNDKVTWPAVYLPSASVIGSDTAAYQRFIIRTDGAPADVIAEARRAFAAIDPQVPLLGPATGPEVLEGATAQHRFVALLLAGLASMGFALAMGGVYGAVALSVSRQKRDVGLRMALGATAQRLVGAFMHTGLRPVVIGALAGAVAVWFAAPRLDVLLFRVAPHDPVSAIVGVGLVLLVAALAAFLPARRISRVDPARTLREN